MNEDPRIMAMNYFISRGMSPYGAAGLVGNLYRESNLVPTVKNDSSGAYGIALWLGPRKTLLFLKYGTNPSLELQLEFVWHELNNTHKRGLKMLNASYSAESAARNAMGYYEFMAGPAAAIREMKRWGLDGERSMREGIKFANNVYDMYNKYSQSLQIPQETVMLQPRFFDKTYSAKLPEVVITGNKPNLNLPSFNDKMAKASNKTFREFDTRPYEFKFTPPAFKDGKDPENTLNGVTTINRTLPEITVTPSDDSGAYLFLANYMIPDKQLRDAFYEYGENSKDPYEYIKRSWDLWNAAGKPYVVPYSSDDAAGRSHYSYIRKQGLGKIFNPIGKIFSPFYRALGLKNIPNTMYIENDTGKHFFSELAHAFQQNADVAVGENTRTTRPEWSDEMHYRYPRTSESNAHYIIEPQLLNYVLKLPNNISIADIIANSNNIATSSLEPIKYKTTGARVNKTPNVTEETINELIKPVRRNHKYDML